MGYKPYWLILLTWGSFISITHAQSGMGDTTMYSSVAKHVIDNYNATIANQAEIYNGTEYHVYPPAYRGSAYFMDKSHCTPGSVLYNGTLYQDIPMLYDMYKDVMVAARGDSLFALRVEKTSDVYLLDHHFIYMDSKGGGGLGAGFYDELYEGKSQVLVKRVRTIESRVTQQGVEVLYENQDIIFIKKGDKYTEVSSKGSVLDAFKDKKSQLNQYLKDNHIKYSADKEGSITKLANYYDQITH